MRGFTVKVKLVNRQDSVDGAYSQLSFSPDYEDSANQEWAHATPALFLQMNVKKEVADKLPAFGKFTGIFELEE